MKFLAGIGAVALVWLAVGYVIGIEYSCRRPELLEKPSRPTLAINPASPGPINDCPRRQWVAYRDDGNGPWIHDCVDFDR